MKNNVQEICRWKYKLLFDHKMLFFSLMIFATNKLTLSHKFYMHIINVKNDVLILQNITTPHKKRVSSMTISDVDMHNSFK